MKKEKKRMDTGIKILLLSIVFLILYIVFVTNFNINILIPDGDNPFALFFLFIAIPVMATFVILKKERRSSEKAIDSLLADRNFESTLFVKANNDKGKIEIRIDGPKGRFVIIEKRKPASPNLRIYDSNKLLSSSIIVDGTEVISASFSSMAGRAVVGGLLFGGVGAIIGGLTGTRQKNEVVRSIGIKLTLDDPENYSVTFYIWSSNSPKPSNSSEVAYFLELATNIQGIFELFMLGETVPRHIPSNEISNYLEYRRLSISKH